MTSQSDVDPVQQLDIDYYNENSAIELVIKDVKNKFSEFQRELLQKGSEILAELSDIKRRGFEIYSMKKKCFYDVYQNREVLQEYSMSTHVNVCWKTGGLGLGDICEIRTSKRCKSISNPPIKEPYGELINLLYKFRHSSSLLNSIDMEYPSEMISTAKRLITNIEHRFPILSMYSLIQHNLKNNRSISDIQDAIHYISKYALCLFYDPSRDIFHTIDPQSNYYIENISSKVDNFDSIIRKMDFVFNYTTQCYTINSLSLVTPQYTDKLAGICCELLLAFEELISFRDKNIDPISYFQSKYQACEFSTVCPITDAIDLCASHRDASLSSQASVHSSPSQSMNYQHRTIDTPSSSLSDTPFLSNCSGEVLQSHTYSTHEGAQHESVLDRRATIEPFRSQAFNSSMDIHQTIPQVQTPNKPSPSEFVTSAFRDLEESNLYSIPDSVNDKATYRSSYRPTQSVMLPKVDSSFVAHYRPCPNCNKSNPINSQVCNWCRMLTH